MRSLIIFFWFVQRPAKIGLHETLITQANEHVCDPYAAMYTGVREWVINYWPDSFLNSEQSN